MLLSEESVNDLSVRAQKSLPPLQLRPNIVVKGCKPYAEDDWEWIKIGDRAIIRNIKSCTRYVIFLNLRFEANTFIYFEY